MTRYRVTAKHFIADFAADEDGTVVHSGPILKWAIDRPLEEVLDILKDRGGTVEILGEDPEA